MAGRQRDVADPVEHGVDRGASQSRMAPIETTSAPLGSGTSPSSRRNGLPGSSCRLARPSGAVTSPSSADQVPWVGVPSMMSRRTRCRPPRRFR